MFEKEVVLYWPNGKLKRKCNFEKGLRHGLDQMWDEEGLLVDEGLYDRGSPVGEHRRWHKTGLLIEEIVYLDSSRFNMRLWDETGTLRLEITWEGSKRSEKIWDTKKI
jgi:hypothetical protein